MPGSLGARGPHGLERLAERKEVGLMKQVLLEEAGSSSSIGGRVFSEHTLQQMP